MKNYQAALKRHLAEYATRRLGVREAGVYQGRAYRHILPARLRFLNVLEGIRAEVQKYLRAHRSVQLHRYFHHLNSSQALTFNLFYPFLAAGREANQILTDALDVGSGVGAWQFEFVPDAAEGTNVDVAWRSSTGGQVFCEVKLSEQEFGAADRDARHRRKRVAVYLPRLQGLVDDSLLEERQFFRHYQLLRNIALLGDDVSNRLIILIPKENDLLRPALEHVIPRLAASTAPRVQVVYLEALIDRLAGTGGNAPPVLLAHVERMREKYIVTRNGAG